MDAEEARIVDAVLREYGIPGVVAPEEPGSPSGPWRVYDHADRAVRRETTAQALAALAAKVRRAGPGAAARRTGGGPTRGFVVPAPED
ncbi:hypothetical protein [Streptomyces sp. DH12]|uniref:hypothetical protein n=1 Tax=Streptomyces sp. DH12 TaxID=2857010 RepID=UPI001E3A528E|nr:hypothetical protein [Streptomyces sp. DH12]